MMRYKVWREGDTYVVKGIGTKIVARGRTIAEAIKNIKEIIGKKFSNRKKFFQTI